jgi:hypothetical protein
MRRAGTWRGRAGFLVCLVVAAGGIAPRAQEKRPYPVFTPDHFVQAMKTVGQAFSAVNASLANSSVEDSKAYLAISRDRLATTITFWRDRQRDDAVRILRDTLTKMDALDAALSAGKIDQAATAAIVKQVGADCQACHQQYREQDPGTKAYRLKAGL